MFCTLVTMATAAILIFFQPHKSCHTLRWIFLQSFMKFDERNPIFFKSPLFCFHGTVVCGSFWRVDVVGETSAIALQWQFWLVLFFLSVTHEVVHNGSQRP
jgi:hypothetical protein